jgi:3-hydroxyisobutyrate dehydrogenase
LSPDVTIVDHTTTSVAGARARTARFRAAGIVYQHAPVFMGPVNARDGTGVMLASGERAQVERLRPALEKMTGKLVYLGPDPTRAAAFKLFGNLYLMFVTAGLTETLTLAKSLDVSPEEAVTLFDWFNPGATIGARVQRILAAEWEKPSWELAMARKDARLMLEEGEQGGVPLTMLPAIVAAMDRSLADGHAHHDWTVIAKDALAPRDK